MINSGNSDKQVGLYPGGLIFGGGGLYSGGGLIFGMRRELVHVVSLDTGGLYSGAYIRRFTVSQLANILYLFIHTGS